MRFEHIVNDIEDLLRWVQEVESERDDFDYDNQLLRERVDQLEKENDELTGELYLLTGDDRVDNDKDYI